jgi:hypothetical protein
MKDLFTLDRLRSRKDVREVGLTSFRLKKTTMWNLTAALMFRFTFDITLVKVASYVYAFVKYVSELELV